MSVLYRTRVCVAGSEQDIRRVLSVLLDNVGYYETPLDRKPFTTQELYQQILTHTREDGDANDTFLYAMVSRHRYGTAEEGTCRLTLENLACGLYTACFRYDSPNPFQIHEWRDLHSRSGHCLMVAQRAASDFTLDKGEVIFSAGEVLDNWNNMCECWAWLIEQYGCGLPPEEAAEHFRAIDRIMQREEYDMNAHQLLLSCRDNLRTLAFQVQEPEAMKEAMDACLVRQDYIHLSEYYYTVAESVLWETEHNAKWLAALEAVIALL